MSHTRPKPFQEATIAAAVARLTDPGGSRRFLVADEVGLGKTVVASGVIERLVAARCETRRAPLRVFYVCSSLSIAHQNVERLLDWLPVEERGKARVQVDRLGLVPGMDEPPRAPLHLYTLTPATSMKTRGPGRKPERLLLGRLLKRVCGVRAAPWFHEALRASVGEGVWEKDWEAMEEPAFRREYLTAFKRRLGHALDVSPRAHRSTLREALQRLLRDPLERRRTLTRLRRSMILAVIDHLRPDLVVLDEFQRFFDVLASETAGDDDDRAEDGQRAGEAEQMEDEDRSHEAHEIMRAMLAPEADVSGRARGPAVLLLSATPYRLFARQRENGRHHEEFFQLLGFLFADAQDDGVRALRSDFDAYRRALLHGEVGSPEAPACKQRIETRLRQVMARTERNQLLARAPAQRHPHPVAVEHRDLLVFRHLAEVVHPEDRAYVEPYWSSIPYPLQMGYAYQAARRADTKRRHTLTGKARLPRTGIENYSVAPRAHPKLRALLACLPEQLLSLPWLPPSRPWWPLGEPFSAVPDASKALVFSRFRAVPRALATLLSYEAELRAFGVAAQDQPYGYFRERSARGRPSERLRQQPSAAFTFRAPPSTNRRLLAMFLPLPALARLGDPLPLTGQVAGALTREQAMLAVRERLVAELGEAHARGDSNPLAWALALERRHHSSWFERCLGEWLETQDDDARHASRALRLALEGAPPGEHPSPADLDALADLSLTAPGTILCRAMTRVFGGPSSDEARAARQARLMSISLGPLRSYLDRSEWHRTLAAPASRGPAPSHGEAVRRAVWAGNLEAVLDEYLVTLQRLGTKAASSDREAAACDELERALAIVRATLHVDELRGEAMDLRTHAAMAFGLRAQSDGKETLRADRVRDAFNSPFRPMVLATTSMGQEGLDFHQYCRHVVHWDLPRNPVDLEQREGRVDRYGGLAVRRALSGRIVTRPVAAEEPPSPWHALAAAPVAAERAQGLVPWWHAEDAEIMRTVLMAKLSAQASWLRELEDELALYRHALGQPNQEALVRALNRRRDHLDEQARAALDAWLQQVALDLRPAP